MAGRPRVYDDDDELQIACDHYFLKSNEEKERPTVTGLALYLGFASKQSLYDYEKQDKFSYPIKKSLLLIENALEKRLTDQAVTGVIFALKNMGWTDRTESKNTNFNIDSEPLTAEEIKEYRRTLQNDY